MLNQVYLWIYLWAKWVHYSQFVFLTKINLSLSVDIYGVFSVHTYYTAVSLSPNSRIQVPCDDSSTTFLMASLKSSLAWTVASSFRAYLLLIVIILLFKLIVTFINLSVIGCQDFIYFWYIFRTNMDIPVFDLWSLFTPDNKCMYSLKCSFLFPFFFVSERTTISNIRFRNYCSISCCLLRITWIFHTPKPIVHLRCLVRLLRFASIIQCLSPLGVSAVQYLYEREAAGLTAQPPSWGWGLISEYPSFASSCIRTLF